MFFSNVFLMKQLSSKKTEASCLNGRMYDRKATEPHFIVEHGDHSLDEGGEAKKSNH